jgi:adenylate cyclase
LLLLTTENWQLTTAIIAMIAIPRRLGEYLDLTPERLHAATQLQVSAGPDQPPRRLGQVLVESGWVTRDCIRAALTRQRAERLRSCELFAHLTDSEINRVCEIASEVSVPSGCKFIDQNTAGDCFYVIASGRVVVFGEYVDDDGQVNESPLTTLSGGQTIGEMGYVSSGRRSASARAIEPTELLRIPYDALPAVFEVVPTLANGFLTVITARLRELNFQYHTAVHHRRAAERSLRHLSEYLDASGHLDLRLDIEQGIEALIRRLIETASKIMNSERASLFLLDFQSGDLWSKVAEGENTREIRIPRGAGIAGWVAEHGQIQNIRDAYADPRFNQDVDKRTGFRTKSILCGPVRNLQGQIIGVIQVINRKSTLPFGRDDEMMFKAFAHQAAIAVENFNLFRRLKLSHEKMALMLDVATSLTETLDLAKLIQKIVTKVSDLLECDRASFFIYDRQTGELWLMEVNGGKVKEIRFPVTSGLAGYCARTGQSLNIPDAYDDPRFNSTFDKQTNYRTRSVLCAPVMDRNNQVAGVTQAINKNGGPFSEEDARFLRAINSQIAVALANAQLFAGTEAMRNYLDSVQQSISNGILTLDDSYHIVTANKAALELFGTEPVQCVRRDLRQILGSPNPAFVSLLDKAYAGDGRARGIELELLVPNSPKKTRVVNVNVLPLVISGDAQGTANQQHGLVIVLEDVTRERRAVGTLSRYVAKEVAEQILSDPDRLKLGGTRSKATILFCDIRDFTTLSENMAAEEVVEMLNGFFSVMVEEILENAGMLDKFLGDGMMALFGVPFVGIDDAIRAVRAALRMKQALAQLNRTRVSRNQRPLFMGISMSTGDVVCGNIGSQRHMNYTVVGDEVNIASRLEGLNKYYGTQILISPITRHEIGDHYAVRLVDHVQVVGRTHPIPIYEVLGEAGAARTDAQRCFDLGLEAYGKRRFSEALELFQRGSVDDAVCRVFVCRCEHFITQPPPVDWNGVWRATGK